MDKKEELIKKLTNKLPEIRRSIGLSQTDFGTLIGLSRQTISSIERGEGTLSWGNYLAIIFLLKNYKMDVFNMYYDVFDGIDDLIVEFNNKTGEKTKK